MSNGLIRFRCRGICRPGFGGRVEMNGDGPGGRVTCASGERSESTRNTGESGDESDEMCVQNDESNKSCLHGDVG